LQYHPVSPVSINIDLQNLNSDRVSAHASDCQHRDSGQVENDVNDDGGSDRDFDDESP
jgi:hypothetical protein